MKSSRGTLNPMVTQLTIPVSKWAAVGGAILVGWQLLGHADDALMKHLDSAFATKQDLQRIEDKIDHLAEALIIRSHQAPAAPPSKK